MILNPTPPFSFERTLEYIRAFYWRDYERVPASQQLVGSPTKRLRRLVSVSGQTVLFEVEDSSDADAPRLELSVYAPGLSDTLLSAVIDRVRFYLSLDDELEPFYARQDPVFAEIIKRLYGYHPLKILTPFEAACWALIQQRTPNGFAHLTMARLAEAFGGRLEHGGITYHAFPEARGMLDDPQARILAATNNTRKTERLLDLIRAFAAVDEAFLRTAPYGEVARWLTGIKGLGAWSLDFIMVRGLGRYERVPWTDTGLLEAVSAVYTDGLSISSGSARELAERYGWYGGLWAHYVKTAAYSSLYRDAQSGVR